MAHYEIDGVKWRVAELLGESFGLCEATRIRLPSDTLTT